VDEYFAPLFDRDNYYQRFDRVEKILDGEKALVEDVAMDNDKRVLNLNFYKFECSDDASGYNSDFINADEKGDYENVRVNQ